MNLIPDERLTRIGIFYDGGFLDKISKYYQYRHPRKKPLSIDGIHNFAIMKVSEVEKVDPNFCRIVDAHYFRGRFSASESEAAGKLKMDREFDDLLMQKGVITHYLPRERDSEKGIDVWFALEAYELAIYKRFNVIVLVTGDGDYIPLVRKLNTIGTRVMLFGWDIPKTQDHDGTIHSGTRTSEKLLQEVTYPILMQHIIDDRTYKDKKVIDNLFKS